MYSFNINPSIFLSLILSAFCICNVFCSNYFRNHQTQENNHTMQLQNTIDFFEEKEDDDNETILNIDKTLTNPPETPTIIHIEENLPPKYDYLY